MSVPGSRRRYARRRSVMGLQENADPVDVHVGKMIRVRRLERHMSQERLGEKLGVAFQQVQKYEKGTNRVSCSGLYRIAQILDAPVSFFFPPDEVGHDTALLMMFLADRAILRLAAALAEVTDERQRQTIIGLAESACTPFRSTVVAARGSSSDRSLPAANGTSVPRGASAHPHSPGAEGGGGSH